MVDTGILFTFRKPSVMRSYWMDISRRELEHIVAAKSFAREVMSELKAGCN